jgi:hypothetical protein
LKFHETQVDEMSAKHVVSMMRNVQLLHGMMNILEKKSWPDILLVSMMTKACFSPIPTRPMMANRR